MKLINIKLSSAFLLALVLIQGVGCKKNYTDPSKVPPDNALTTARGLTGVVVGLHRVYTFQRASSLYNQITTDGFVTRQLNIINQGNTAEYQLFQGGTAVDGTNTILAGLWTGSNKLIFDANNVLRNAPALVDKGYASGLIAYASIFKALALGNLAMNWDHVPDSISTIGNSVTFITAAEAYNKAIGVLDNALNVIAANPISTQFLANVPAGIDIVNTIHALKARYALNAGNWALALTEANAVDLTKKSTFNFDAVTLNPIWETATSTNNVYQPIDSTMGLPPSIAPSLTDKRVPFYIVVDPPSAQRFKIKGFGATSSSAWPLYLPGEMTLIKAEVSARQNNLPNTIIFLNQVLTKKPADDPFGVGADQPPYAGAVTQPALLEQIYRNRSIELYMSGLRLQDQRRLERPLAERKRNYMPYPFVERDNNTNTPPDPPN
ncbi:RagB/SusD family nutrient uptake outer membrane protein [Paraflavitalea soli]|uniref:RagB/SusD family nutrient uptake outer membrane protein n=1 Tax=Paraflavitalea soli TaxID=2315862 RepID=A0A3B7MNQ3_9BACT|nr:RagB/SusD family nutrient uptake outer membrane protein [Paraflavitalea soli]AXY75397.1 RagB/SusD family nutrient uptake outer membrane protein [Paraflavitalea soli]